MTCKKVISVKGPHWGSLPKGSIGSRPGMFDVYLCTLFSVYKYLLSRLTILFGLNPRIGGLLMFTVYFHSNVFKRRPNGLLMFQSPFDSIPAVLTSGGCQAHQAMAKQRWDMGQRLGTNA
jgi:hypothetical protein